MCRLYGFHSNEPTKVECSLVYAQNALLNQSVLDARGEANADGWGIGFYDDGVPTIERRDTAAHSDSHFSTTAERVFARTVVAHIRSATVGAHLLENTHPFRYGTWLFAHNGTVSGFDAVRARLDHATDADLLALRRGTTDSETAFLWLLTRMRRAGLNPGEGPGNPESMVDELRRAIADLDGLCADAAPDDPALLNLLLTDGHTLIGSCYRRTLYYVERTGIHDCEICGIPHITHDKGTCYRAAVVASEPITHEEWRSVPDRSLISVSQSLETSIHPI